MSKPLVLSLCVILLLSGCVTPGAFPVPRDPTPTSVPGTEVPFEVVMQAEISAYTGTEPALYLVTSLDDAQVVVANLVGGYPEEFLEWVQRLKDRQVLLALFREPHGSGGYEIRTNHVVLRDDALQVYVEICDTLGGRLGIAAHTEYFQIVQVSLPPEAPPAAALTPVLVDYAVNC